MVSIGHGTIALGGWIWSAIDDDEKKENAANDIAHSRRE